MRANESLQTSDTVSDTWPSLTLWHNEKKKTENQGKEQVFLFYWFMFRAADCLWTHLSPSVPPQRTVPAINPDHQWWNTGRGCCCSLRARWDCGNNNTVSGHRPLSPLLCTWARVALVSELGAQAPNLNLHWSTFSARFLKIRANGKSHCLRHFREHCPKDSCHGQPCSPGREDRRNDPRNFFDMLNSLICGIFWVCGCRNCNKERGGLGNGGVEWLIKKTNWPPDSSELFQSNKMMAKPTLVLANSIRDAPASLHLERNGRVTRTSLLSLRGARIGRGGGRSSIVTCMEYKLREGPRPDWSARAWSRPVQRNRPILTARDWGTHWEKLDVDKGGMKVD